MNSKKGTIYLIQPAELVGTKRYKIGCSSKNDLERCKKGYKKGTRFMDIRECDDPFAVEREVKTRFNTKFNLIAGKEYFEGNEADIKKEFNDVVSKFTLLKQHDDVYFKFKNQGISIYPLLPKSKALFNIEDNDIPIDDNILTTPDINKKEYEFLIQKQVDNWATAEDKLKIKRYIFKKCLGLDYLNCDELGRSIVKNYDFSTLKKYVGLISDKNIPFSNDNFYIEEVKKVEVIKNIIENLGFKNMYDRTTKLSSDEFKQRISLLDVFDDDKAMRILFKIRSIKNKFDSLKSFLGCVNSILQPYSLKINSNRKKINQIETQVYKLDYVLGRENIDELLQYRINKGFSINTDIRHFTNNNYYAELIKIKEMDVDSDDDTKYKMELD